MDLKSIAMDALKDAENDNASEQKTDDMIQSIDNGDGTVSFKLSFSLDPKVVAEKAKAMAKGVKREDMADDLPFSDDVKTEKADPKVDTDEDPFNGPDVDQDDDQKDAEDEAPTDDSLFQNALSEIDTEDARPQRHGKTPLENCRAKDPRFCPYHGVAAWKSHLEDALKSANAGGLVTVSDDDGKFSAMISNVPTKDELTVKNILQKLLGVNGVIPTTGQVSEGENSAGAYRAGVEFKKDWKQADRSGLLNEWMDDFMIDTMSDPNAEVDMDAMNAVLEGQDAIEQFQQTMDPNDANDVAKFDAMVSDTMDKYHYMTAQSDMADVTDVKTATAKSANIDQIHQAQEKLRQDALAQVHAVKYALWPQPNRGGSPVLPRGFANANPWVAEYNEKAKRSSRPHREYAAAQVEYQAEIARSTPDIKKLRLHLNDMAYRADLEEAVTPKYVEAAQQFCRDAYDWATKTNNPNVAAAFPNGKPQ